MKFAHRFLLGWACCLLPFAASAQWQWIDNHGKKVFSDQPPPAEVPEKNILRRAGVPPSRGATGAPAEMAPARATEAVAPKPAGVDKELEAKKKKAQDEEKARQDAEAAKVAKAKADNCERARQAKATYDSGMRVARVNANGEREILDDTARAAEQKRLQSIIQSDCK
jgi:type IV secretory pathway VirB10-like protein